MDPNVTLTILRQLAEQVDEDINATERERDLATFFFALDGWLTTKGFLPEDWKRG